jgi:nitrite reductase (NADH) large subunit
LKTYEHIIIGNSAAGLNALETLRKYDSESSVLVISREGCPAYSRVLLPYYLKGKIGYDKLFLHGEEFYTGLGADTVFDIDVVDLDSVKKYIALDNGEQIAFNKLLIATGSSPVKPRINGIESPGIYNLWTLQDAQNIERMLSPGKKIVVIGSGFISLMMAWIAVLREMQVTVIELMPRIMPQALDESGSELLHNRMLDYGIDVKVDALTEKIECEVDQLCLSVQGNEPVVADLVVVAAGVRTNTEFLKNSTVLCERGVLVDGCMESSVDGIFAAGDVAQGPTVFGETHVNVPLWSTAVEQGKVAGANMAGQRIVYEGSLSMNVTEMFGLTIASMGQIGLEDDTWKEVYNSHNSYVKIIRRGQIPVGLVTVGSPELVRLSGYCRPLIRQGRDAFKSLDCLLHEMN